MNNELKQTKRYLNLAKQYFNGKEYEKCLLYLVGTKSYVFVLIHSFPKYYGLPYPSFRLLKSIEKIDKRLYGLVQQIYTINNKDSKKILCKYALAYKLMSRCYKNINPTLSNYGFYDKIKVKYNLENLKETYNQYPKIYADRFIIGCVTSWALGSDEVWKNSKNNRKKDKMRVLMLNILGLSEVSREFVEKKLNLTLNLDRLIGKIIH